jgi:hypothetical protein
VTSPSVSLESILITATIEAYEGRDVAVFGVPGIFMSNTAPNIYRKYIMLDVNSKPVIYVKLQKALYGCFRSALLFYLKMVKDPESKDFEINPCDPCVVNNMILLKQFTVT